MPYMYPIDTQYRILFLEGEIEIKKAQLDAYIMEESSRLVDNFFYEADENDQNKNNGNDDEKKPSGKGIIMTIFDAISGLFNGIIESVTKLFSGSVSDQILSDPSKKVELKGNPDQLAAQALEDIYSESKVIKGICSVINTVTGGDVTPGTVGDVADKAAVAGKTAVALFGVKNLFGFVGKIKDKVTKGQREADDVKNVVNNNYDKLSDDQKKECKKHCGKLRGLCNTLVEQLVTCVSAVQDNAVDWFALGIFDSDTPKDVSSKWKALKDDDLCPRDMVQHMKIQQKVADCRDYIIGGGGHLGAKSIGYEDEAAVRKSFDLFAQKASQHPDNIKKSEVRNFFKDLRKIQGLKKKEEKGAKGGDNDNSQSNQQSPDNQNGNNS